MKKILLITGIILFTIPLIAQNADKGGEVYIIQSGDTLWGLAQQFYQNPWLWPRIWEANPYIDDPNLIYPGKPLAIPKVLSGPPPKEIASTQGIVETHVSKPLRPVTGVTVPPPVEAGQGTASNAVASSQESSQVVQPLSSEGVPPPPPFSPQISEMESQETATMPEEIEEPTVQTIVIPQPPPSH